MDLAALPGLMLSLINHWLTLKAPQMRLITLVIVLIALAAGPMAAQTRVIDGDTLEIDGQSYRLNGIDAPEHGQSCGDWACGADATQALADLIETEKVVCDASGADSYGRKIATCFVGEVDLGRSLVEQGKAWAFLRYSDVYAAEERAAKARRTGIWAGQYQTPWAFREARWSSADAGPNGCRIKGNISDNGRIYHAPWSPWYKRTRINLSKGERWFCDEAEALAAGWRAPYWN
jgi:endonuclease YncB( thermonuclease family)